MSVVSGDGELTGAVDEMEVYLGEYDRQFMMEDEASRDEDRAARYVAAETANGGGAICASRPG
ncbi:hypothetical protein PI124_g14448 [Phytophthora idaei]|nr:hypothetical protein PI124_g14448 [Phytophthora idaei]